jgi:DNA-binding NtrC family response regulator
LALVTATTWKGRTCTLSWLAEREPQLRPIVVAAPGDASTAWAALDAGAWDVLAGEGAPGELLRRLRAAARLRRLQGPPAPASSAAQGPDEAAAGAPSIGTERRMSTWGRGVAATDVPMLITGERGTGKQFAALAIHERSPRAHGPFIPIDCAVIPTDRIEVELFGRESSAVDGPTDARRGRFEAAHGGTLYVAAIDQLPLRLQAGLLRFLEHRALERVGGHASIRPDVRVIAATERDLRSAVDRGDFLEDLCDRLAVFRVHLPPLRERGEYVAMLASWYLDRSAWQEGRDLEGFSEAAIASLRAARWPGNVRELIVRVRRAAVMAAGPRVTPEDLGLAEPRAETGNGT